MQFHVVVVPAQEIRKLVTWVAYKKVRNNVKSLNSQYQLVVAGAYRRDSNCKTYWVGFGVLDRWSHMEA